MIETLTDNWPILPAVAAAVWLVVLLIYVIQFRHRYYYPKPGRQAHTPHDFQLPALNINFRLQHDLTERHAWYVPQSTSLKHPTVLFMHGWDTDATVWLPLAAELYQDGFSLLLPDARGHGRHSQNVPCTVADVTEDILTGIAWLKTRAETDVERISVIGHSLGAVAALAAAHRSRDVWRAIGISAYVHATDPLLGDARRSFLHRVAAWLNVRAAEFLGGFRYRQYNVIDLVKEIRCPVLLVHGERDRIVPVRHANMIYTQSNPDTTQLLIIPNIGHGAILRSEALTSGVEGFLLCRRKDAP
jgi:pimeloyl-ACP methyl ester carboxylesterase